MEIAEVISKRGTCGRAQVGCVITQDDRIVATGYNGPVHGWNCEEKYCGDMTTTCTHAIHAEANAIVFAAKKGIALEGSKMYCITAPCISCARLIIQSGIKTLYYKQPYRDSTGITILRISGVRVIQNPYISQLSESDEEE